MKNCAFQYAYSRWSFLDTIESNEVDLTLDEARALWNKYYPQAARKMANGNGVEMVLWINMVDGEYKEYLHYVRPTFHSDGKTISERITTVTEIPATL